jgi:hypothetical protein
VTVRAQERKTLLPRERPTDRESRAVLAGDGGRDYRPPAERG